MTDFGLEQMGVIGGDWFKLIKARRSKVKLEYYLDQFNEEDYWIYKVTSKQRLISSEWKEFKYSGYIFFKKEIYKREDIDKWLNFINTYDEFKYMSNPFPPIEIMKKIKVIKCGH